MNARRDAKTRLMRWLGLALAMVFLGMVPMGYASARAEVDEFGLTIGSDEVDPNLPVQYFEETQKQKYALRIDIKAQRTTAYEMDENGRYVVPVRVMKCSTGLDETPTPLGLYANATSRADEWYYFKEFKVWAQYATRIVGGILFHSVLYEEPDVNTLISGSVSKLGKKASHGCIRMSVEDAKWIYDNCGSSTTVHILESDPYRPANNKVGGTPAGDATETPSATPKPRSDEGDKATPKPSATKAAPKPTATSSRTRR